MKKSLFLRTVSLSLVIVFCLVFGFLGIAKAYENIRLVAYGEYRKAVEINKDNIRFFDFTIGGEDTQKI